MNEAQMSGAARDAAGKVKTFVGNLTGDAKLAAEGGLDRATGTVRRVLGDGAESALDMADRARDAIEDRLAGADAVIHKTRDALADGMAGASDIVRSNPLAAVGIAALVAFLFGRATAPQSRRHWF